MHCMEVVGRWLMADCGRRAGRVIPRDYITEWRVNFGNPLPSAARLRSISCINRWVIARFCSILAPRAFHSPDPVRTAATAVVDFLAVL